MYAYTSCVKMTSAHARAVANKQTDEGCSYSTTVLVVVVVVIIAVVVRLAIVTRNKQIIPGHYHYHSKHTSRLVFPRSLLDLVFPEMSTFIGATYLYFSFVAPVLYICKF